MDSTQKLNDIILNMKLLIVVNPQNDFVDGCIGYPDAINVIDRISANIKEFDDFIYVIESHDKDYLTTVEGKYLQTPHTIKGTKGFEVCDKLKEFKPKTTIVSNGFGAKGLIDYLEKHEYEEIYLCGLFLHIQVLENAIIAKTFSPLSKIIVLRELSGTYDKKYAMEAENILRSNHIEVR